MYKSQKAWKVRNPEAVKRQQMNADLEKKLYAKYPKIFRQKDLSMRETCMCWGIACSDGWYELLDNLCWKLQSMTDSNPDCKDQNGNLRFPQIEATQVKEKYGTLRFYTNVASDWQDGVIDFAETMSASICDVCGKPGKLNSEGWVEARCPEHKDQRWYEDESENGQGLKEID